VYRSKIWLDEGKTPNKKDRTMGRKTDVAMVSRSLYMRRDLRDAVGAEAEKERRGSWNEMANILILESLIRREREKKGVANG
jgi:hypothetical protein